MFISVIDLYAQSRRQLARDAGFSFLSDSLKAPDWEALVVETFQGSHGPRFAESFSRDFQGISGFWQRKSSVRATH